MAPRLAALALLSLLVSPGQAHADPISLSLLLGGLVGGGGFATAGLGFGFLTSLGVISSIVTSVAVSVAVMGAVALINALFQPSPAAAVFNVKVDQGPRRHAMGTAKLGGQTIFGAFSGGAFWYIVVHCDEPLIGAAQVRLDDRPVTLDGSNRVTNGEFHATTGGFLGIGAGNNSFYTVWTITYTPGNPVPTIPAAFTSAFPDWTTDHKLVGLTFSIVKIDPVDDKTHGQIYKWQQGAFHLGEPGVQIIGTFGVVYDPRDPAQDIDDATTWQPSSNSALLWAWWRYFRYGFNNDIHALAWDQIAFEADVCDTEVADKNGFMWPRYACSAVWAESKDNTNGAIEKKILATCDGIVLTDATGKLYCHVGRWEEPDLSLTGDRDVASLNSQPVENGETQLDGAVVSYMEADYGYIIQPSAPYFSEFYEPGTTPDFLSATIEFCPSHNQAIRLAKAISAAGQAPYKLGVSLGVRSIIARRKRVLSLDLGPDDTDYSGPMQPISPVDIDLNSMTGTTTLAPVTSDSWTLLPGEEGDKPRRDLVDFDATIPAAAGVVVTAVPVAGSNGNSVRLQATFSAPSAATYAYDFEYSPDGGATWQAFETDMPALKALSPIIDATASYLVRWRTVTSGGNYGAYGTPVSVIALAHVTADLVSVRADSISFTADAS